MLDFRLSVLVLDFIPSLAAVSCHMESPGSFFKVLLSYFKLCLCFCGFAGRWLQRGLGLALDARFLEVLEKHCLHVGLGTSGAFLKLWLS